MFVCAVLLANYNVRHCCCRIHIKIYYKPEYMLSAGGAYFICMYASLFELCGRLQLGWQFVFKSTRRVDTTYNFAGVAHTRTRPDIP